MEEDIFLGVVAGPQKGGVMPKPENTITVDVGSTTDADYQVPNYLKAIDAITCFFKHSRIGDDSQIADALEMYARHLRKVG